MMDTWDHKAPKGKPDHLANRVPPDPKDLKAPLDRKDRKDAPAQMAKRVRWVRKAPRACKEPLDLEDPPAHKAQALARKE
jgi:hypothetical protein